MVIVNHHGSPSNVFHHFWACQVSLQWTPCQVNEKLQPVNASHLPLCFGMPPPLLRAYSLLPFWQQTSVSSSKHECMRTRVTHSAIDCDLWWESCVKGNFELKSSKVAPYCHPHRAYPWWEGQSGHIIGISRAQQERQPCPFRRWLWCFHWNRVRHVELETRECRGILNWVWWPVDSRSSGDIMVKSIRSPFSCT